MKKAILSFLLMISLVLLCACGGEAADKERFDDFRQELNEAAGVSFSVSLTANFGDTVGEYGLDCSHDGENTGLEITSPAELAGIRAHTCGDELTLEYDGVILSAGELTDDGMTPVSAVPAMINAMEEGYVSSSWREFDDDERWCVFRISVTDEVSMTLWMDYDTMTPVSAELVTEGVTVAGCSFDSWEIT